MNSLAAAAGAIRLASGISFLVAPHEANRLWGGDPDDVSPTASLLLRSMGYHGRARRRAAPAAPASATTGVPPAGSSPSAGADAADLLGGLANHDRLPARSRAIGLGGAVVGIAVGVLGGRELREPGVLAAPHLQRLAPGDRAQRPARPSGRGGRTPPRAPPRAPRREPARRLDRGEVEAVERGGVATEDRPLHLGRQRRVAEPLLEPAALISKARNASIWGCGVPYQIESVPHRTRSGPTATRSLPRTWAALVGVAQFEVPRRAELAVHVRPTARRRHRAATARAGRRPARPRGTRARTTPVSNPEWYTQNVSSGNAAAAGPTSDGSAPKPLCTATTAGRCRRRPGRRRGRGTPRPRSSVERVAAADVGVGLPRHDVVLARRSAVMPLEGGVEVADLGEGLALEQDPAVAAERLGEPAGGLHLLDRHRVVVVDDRAAPRAPPPTCPTSRGRGRPTGRS